MAEKTAHSPATSLLSIKLLPYSQEFFFPFALFSRFFDSGPEKIAPNEPRGPNQNTGIQGQVPFSRLGTTHEKSPACEVDCKQGFVCRVGKRYLPLYSQFVSKPVNAALTSTGKLKMARHWPSRHALPFEVSLCRQNSTQRHCAS